MNTFQRISAADTQAALNETRTCIVDIRDAHAFAAGHIEGALRIDNDNLATFIANTDKDARLIVCCYHGISSQNAAQFFIEQGFNEVYSLDGGFEGWRASYPYAR